MSKLYSDDWDSLPLIERLRELREHYRTEPCAQSISVWWRTRERIYATLSQAETELLEAREAIDAVKQLLRAQDITSQWGS